MGTYNVDTWQLVPTKQEDPMGRANRDADSAKRFLLEIRDSGHVTPETRGISVTFLKPEIELQEAVIQTVEQLRCFSCAVTRSETDKWPIVLIGLSNRFFPAAILAVR
ncbi:hypothetical protein QQP08_009226 [Theobroma cacao]|nr:hypothetical protein QQP08_009226 [Theobroma cacao]